MFPLSISYFFQDFFSILRNRFRSDVPIRDSRTFNCHRYQDDNRRRSMHTVCRIADLKLEVLSFDHLVHIRISSISHSFHLSEKSSKVKVYNTISKLRCFRTALECLLFGIQNINYTDFPLSNMFHSQVFHLRNCIHSRTEQFMISINLYLGFVFCWTKVNDRKRTKIYVSCICLHVTNPPSNTFCTKI